MNSVAVIGTTRTHQFEWFENSSSALLDFKQCADILPHRLRRIRERKERNDATVAGWSSPVAREAHNLEVVGSNPAPATTRKADPIGSAFSFPSHISQPYRDR